MMAGRPPAAPAPAVQHTRQVPFPVSVGSQPVVVTGTGGTESVKARPGIVVKQTVRQEVGTKKARKRRVAKASKQSLKSKKSEYAQLKKGLRKRLMQQRKEGYKAETARINTLPKKDRATARKTLKARLKQAYDAKIKMLPALGKRSYNDIVALISKLRKFKW